MPTGKYKLKSAARPTQYLSLVDGKIVGHTDKPGVVNEWFVMFDEKDWGKFQPIRDGEICDEYIYFDDLNQSLVMYNEGTLFPVLENSHSTPDSRLFAIAIDCTDQVWALLSWDDTTPVVTQTNKGSTEQLWVFEKCGA